MSRVKAVVGKTIMVDIRDVIPGDILHHSGTESDTIIEKILKYHRVSDNVDLYRFVYKMPNKTNIPHSKWMNPEDHRFGNGCVFIHDLKRERFEFEDQDDLQDRVSS